jgi:hypothetical protein
VAGAAVRALPDQVGEPVMAGCSMGHALSCSEVSPPVITASGGGGMAALVTSGAVHVIAIAHHARLVLGGLVG